MKPYSLSPYDMLFGPPNYLSDNEWDVLHADIIHASGWWELTLWDDLYNDYVSSSRPKEDIKRMSDAISYHP